MMSEPKRTSLITATGSTQTSLWGVVSQAIHAASFHCFQENPIVPPKLINTPKT